MKILKTYSFKHGLEIMKKEHPKELEEIIDAIRSVDSSLAKTKKSREKTINKTI